MLKALRFKFKQNEHLKKVLMDTESAILIEHTKRDSYWGDGGDGNGCNQLGVLLMRVRAEMGGHTQPQNKKRKIKETKTVNNDDYESIKERKALLDAQRERIWA